MFSSKKISKSYDTLPSSSSSSSSSSEIFGECSDYSDGYYADTKPKGKKKNRLLSWSKGISDQMGKTERSALLRCAANPATTYRAIITSDDSDTLGPAEFPSSEMLNLCKKRYENDAIASQKQSSLVTIFSVWNTVMGSSLLAMAWGVVRAGLPTALLLLATMAALCLYTAHLLLRLGAMHGGSECEVPALCRALLGRGAAALAHAFSLLVLLGATVVYWILLTNFLFFTVNYAVDWKNSNQTEYNSTLVCPRYVSEHERSEPIIEDRYWSLHTTVPLYVALLVFPLLNFKDVSFFTKFNSLGTLSVLYLVLFVLVKSVGWGLHTVATNAVDGEDGKDGEGWDAAALSGMLALSFYIHNIIITIMNNNANQNKNGRDLTIAFVLVTLTYSMVGAVFYVCFPLAKSCIEDNILNNFEIHDPMSALARALLLFQVVTVYPLVAFMLRSEAILLLPVPERMKSTRWMTLIVNMATVTICILFACFCPDIGTIIRYTGAVSGMVHIFALPALLQLRSLHLRRQLTKWKLVFFSMIIALGIFNLLVQFFIE